MDISVSAGESSDDDIIEVLDMIPYQRRAFKKPQAFYYLNDAEFRFRYRLSKELVLRICEMIDRFLAPRTKRKNTLSTLDQLLIALRYYATGVFQVVNSDMFELHQTTVSRVIKHVSNVVASLSKEFIKMPSTADELTSLKQSFYNMIRPHGIPSVIGLIDCTHVKIISPGGDDSERYRNRKGYFSINVQAIGSPNLKFLDLIARWPGSTHDAYIFDMSPVKGKILRGDYGECFLLGDGGYACTNYMLTPLTNPTTPSEQTYQKTQILMRNAIERQFGVWKRRFPVLATGSQINIKTVLSMIVATGVLHNIAIDNNDRGEDFESITQEEEIDQVPLPTQAPQENMRNNIIRNFFT